MGISAFAWLLIIDVFTTVFVTLLIAKNSENIDYIHRVAAVIPFYYFSLLMLTQLDNPYFLIVFAEWLLFQAVCVIICYFTASAVVVFKSWTEPFVSTRAEY